MPQSGGGKNSDCPLSIYLVHYRMLERFRNVTDPVHHRSKHKTQLKSLLIDKPTYRDLRRTTATATSATIERLDGSGTVCKCKLELTSIAESKSTVWPPDKPTTNMSSDLASMALSADAFNRRLSRPGVIDDA